MEVQILSWALDGPGLKGPGPGRAPRAPGRHGMARNPPSGILKRAYGRPMNSRSRAWKCLAVAGAVVAALLALGSAQQPEPKEAQPPAQPPPAPTSPGEDEGPREAVVQLRDGQRYTGL